MFLCQTWGYNTLHCRIRSGEEQWIRYELIKALSNFKHNVVPPPSPSFLQNTSSEKEAIVVSPKSTQLCSETKLKNKCKKPFFKVTRDMLTKKWIFVKKEKKLGDWSLQRFLHNYKKLPCASSVGAIGNVSEVVLLLEGIRKLMKGSENKKKKKVLCDKHNPIRIEK